MPLLVVVVGPIASGKSTVAKALGVRLRSAGRRVVVLDLDDLVDTIGGFVDLPPERFVQAQRVFGKLAGSWLDERFDVVAHGPFFSHSEDAALLHAVPASVVPRRVLLETPLDVALERVHADPDRLLADHPELLTAAYDRASALVPEMAPSEWTFDTSTIDATTIVDRIVAALLP